MQCTLLNYFPLSNTGRFYSSEVPNGLNWGNHCDKSFFILDMSNCQTSRKFLLRTRKLYQRLSGLHSMLQTTFTKRMQQLHYFVAQIIPRLLERSLKINVIVWFLKSYKGWNYLARIPLLCLSQLLLREYINVSLRVWGVSLVTTNC
jgi:hypothetical protein